MGRFSKLLAPKFLDLAKVSDHGRILEAGCGTGALTSRICDHAAGARITAVDVSRAYVDFAARRIDDPRVAFEVADIARLPYPDAHFDQVLSQLVLDFVPDTARAFAEIGRVLKPGGSFSAAVWDARGGLVFNRLSLDTAAVIDDGAARLRNKNSPVRSAGRGI